MSNRLNINMMTVHKLFKNKSLQKNLPNLPKKPKRDFNIPFSVSNPILYNNIYSSLSEKQRHLSMIEKFYNLRQLISNDPKHEYILLKEFINKLGIKDSIYCQSNRLLQLSTFINGDITLDPNKSLKENTINILEKTNGNNQSSTSHMINNSILNKEKLYISPMIFNKNNKMSQSNKFCRKHLNKTVNKNSIQLPLIRYVNDFLLMQRNNKDNDKQSNVNKYRSQNQSIELLEKEFYKGIESYVNQNIDNNRKYLFEIFNRDNSKFKEDILKRNMINKSNNESSAIGISNNSFSSNTDRSAVFITNHLEKRKLSDKSINKNNHKIKKTINLDSKKSLMELHSKISTLSKKSMCNQVAIN